MTQSSDVLLGAGAAACAAPDASSTTTTGMGVGEAGRGGAADPSCVCGAADASGIELEAESLVPALEASLPRDVGDQQLEVGVLAQIAVRIQPLVVVDDELGLGPEIDAHVLA